MSLAVFRNTILMCKSGKFAYTDGPAPFKLSSGSSYTAHGESVDPPCILNNRLIDGNSFINGWTHEAAQNMLLATDKRKWQTVTGIKQASTCVPKDRDPYNTSGAKLSKRQIMRAAHAWLDVNEKRVHRSQNSSSRNLHSSCKRSEGCRCSFAEGQLINTLYCIQ